MALAVGAGILLFWALPRIKALVRRFNKLEKLITKLQREIELSEERVIKQIIELQEFAASRDQLLKHSADLNTQTDALRKWMKEHSVEELSKALQRHGRKEFRQIESLVWLKEVLGIKGPLPWTRGWVASPDLLLFLHEIIRQHKPNIVVELGSGVSTLVIADALRTVGSGRVISIDHLEQYGKQTREYLAREGLLSVAEVRIAPLVILEGMDDKTGDGQRYWYDQQVFADLEGIDLLVVDGPPGNTCKWARYPAVPQLYNRLSDRCIVLLDDANRKEEKELAEAWEREFGLEKIVHKDFEKGLAVLQWSRR